MKGRKTGGRVAGTPNKATASVKAAAQRFTTEAIKTLAEIMRNGATEAARVAAADKLLDRAHGRPAQAIGGDKDGEAIRVVAEIQRVIVKP